MTDPVQYNPYDYRIHEDPYPTYARLREEAPLYHNGEQGFWALSRHEDVIAGFRNPAQLSNRFGVSLDPAAYGPEAHRAMSFLGMDPPRHTRMRSLVSKGFTPRRVADLEARIHQIATDHLDAALQREEFDFVADLAGLLPMDVISEMLGLPTGDRVELRRLSDAALSRAETVIAANEATCIYLLPRVFSEYRRLFPAVQLDVDDTVGRAPFARVVEQVGDRALGDVAHREHEQRAGPVGDPRVLADLEADADAADVEHQVAGRLTAARG